MNNFEEFSLVGKDLYMLGLVDSMTGSLSVRSGERIYITKRNAMLGHLQESDIVGVPLEGEGESVELAAWELQVHRAIYREGNFSAVVHAYPPYGIALSIGTENKIIPADIKGQAVLRSIPVVRARPIAPGKERTSTEDLAKFLPPVFKSGYLISLVKDFGSFAVGGNLSEALQYTTCLENSCKIIAINKSLVSAEKQNQPQRDRQPARRSAIPPSIGVMDRTRASRRGFGR
jgi:ribulose-5-phosphate 4-epimerase/fuculose-1-phosphate aldolase